ncbi:MAG: hypothetical protein OXD43_13875 [Bacteroidetes bacterium]|nr:hypothetical protein [Bacteroidota bacterium]
MRIKLQIGEKSANFPRAVKAPHGAKREELILIVSEAPDEQDTWGMLTVPLLRGEDEWCYQPLSAEEVCQRLAQQLHESNCNYTGEDFVERFNRALELDCQSGPES